MIDKAHFKRENISIIGIIPQYPRHSQNNIFAKIRMPPVGLISIISQINHYPEFNVYAIDENNYAGPRDFTGMPDHNFLQKKEPAKIAMFYGGMSNSIPRMFSLAKQYKKSGALTIAGGSHVDALPKETLNSGIDIVVHGEGEETVKEILDAILKDGKIISDYEKYLKKIPGISFLDENNKHVFTGKRIPIRDLDELRYPDLTLIKFLKKRWSAIPINRGRGCNFKCEFCVVNKQYGSFKAGSVEKALEQVIKYSDLGYKKFFFTDDNFSQDIEQTIELCKMIGDYKRKFGKKINLIVQVRSEIAENEELIEAMRYAGVKTLCIGYESPINNELKAMKKGVTVKKLIERSRKLSDYFYLHGMFIFGYPLFKDSNYKSDLTLKERAKKYARFFRKARIDTVQVLNAVPLPGSELRAKLEAEKRILPSEMVGWDKYDGLFLCYDPTPEGLDPYELQNIPKVLMKKRYLGNFIDRNLNYGNWVNWTYNVTAGFPIQFGMFYTKRFVSNLIEKKRERRVDKENILLPKRNIFYEPLINAWGDFKRKWRNLVIKTYAGGILRRWSKEYEKSGYSTRLKQLLAKQKVN